MSSTPPLSPILAASLERYGSTVPLLSTALACLVGLAFLVSFFPIEESNDAWWHLKAGKLIWEGELNWYTPDLFTFSARDRVWLNHEWLGEWLFYLCFRVGGFTGAILGKTLIIVAFFLVAFRCCLLLLEETDKKTAIAAALVSVALVIPTSQFTLYLRPPIYTFLLVAIYQWGILRLRGGDPGWGPTLVGAGLMALWANLHGGAILGCVLVAMMAFGAFIRDTLDSRRATGLAGFSHFFRWSRTAAVISLASLVNPYGYHLHLLTFDMMARRWLTERIPELAPPPIDLIWTIPLLLVPGALGVFRRGGWGERLIFLFLVWQGLSHVRHLPILALWAAPYAAATLASAWASPGKVFGILVGAGFPFFALLHLWGAPFPLPVGFLGVRYLVVALMAAVALWRVLSPGRGIDRAYLAATVIALSFVVIYPGGRIEKFLRAAGGEGWSGRNYPNQLVDLIEKEGLSSPALLARENYAGYLIWRLAPEKMRVFTCSRFDLQGELPRMELETLLWLGEESWSNPQTGETIPPWTDLWDSKYRFDLVILEKYSDHPDKVPFPLYTHLSDPSSGFIQLATEEWPGRDYPDQVFSLFARDTPALREKIQAGLKRQRFSEPPEAGRTLADRKPTS